MNIGKLSKNKIYENNKRKINKKKKKKIKNE